MRLDGRFGFAPSAFVGVSEARRCFLPVVVIFCATTGEVGEDGFDRAEAEDGVLLLVDDLREGPFSLLGG